MVGPLAMDVAELAVTSDHRGAPAAVGQPGRVGGLVIADGLHQGVREGLAEQLAVRVIAGGERVGTDVAGGNAGQHPPVLIGASAVVAVGQGLLTDHHRRSAVAVVAGGGDEPIGVGAAHRPTEIVVTGAERAGAVTELGAVDPARAVVMRNRRGEHRALTASGLATGRSWAEPALLICGGTDPVRGASDGLGEHRRAQRVVIAVPGRR